MKEFQFERKQRFSLRKYAIGACSVLLGTSLFFAGMGAQPVQATETSSTLISSHYLDEQDLPEKLKSELQWFEENKIEVKERKEYYFIYRKLATRLPETGLFSNDGMFIMGAGLLLLSFTLIKRKRGASYFLVTVFAVGGWGASISALENLVELQPALVKRVEGQFLPSPETVQGYEFTGYYLVRDSASKELSVDKVESPVLSQKEDSSEPQSKKIVPQTASHFSSTKDLVQSPQPSYAVEPVLNPTPEKSMSIESKKVPDEGMKTVIEDKPELEVRIGEIEFETQFQSDPTLAKGEKRISIEGAKGQERILTEVRVVDGIVTRNEVGREVLREPVTQVILVGTKEKEPQENGISLAPEVQPTLPSYEGGVSGESLVEPALPSYEGGVPGESLVEPSLPSYEGGVSGASLVEPSLPSYEGGVSGESLVEPSLPSYEGGVSGESLVELSLPSYEGGVSGESLVEPALPSYEGGASGESLVEPSLPSYEGGVSGESLVEPALPSYEGGASGESLVEPSLPSYEGGVSGESLVEPPLPSYEGGVSGESLVEPSLPSYEGGVSGESLVEPSLPSYEGGVSGEPEIQEALPEYKEDTQLPQTKVETKAVPYETIYEKNEALDHGVTRVKIPGIEGQEQVTTTYTKDQASGNISENKTVKIVVNKVDQVVEVGTKPSVETTVLSHKTIYQVNPALEFRQEKVAVAGRDGSVETRTTYQLDKATGQVTVSDTTRQVNPAVDKVIQVGNVEKVIQPIAVTEERREDSSLAKNIEKVASEGEVGENTLTRTYAINEQTGELVNPQEASQITKPMKPRVVLVGSQEDKPHILPANSEREDAVDVTEATAEMRNVDLLTNEKLKSQLAPSDIEINRDFFLKRNELRKTNPNITESEVKEILRKEYLEKLSIKETLDATKTDLEASLKKVAAHTLSIMGNTQENKEKVEQDIEANKEKILLGLSYIHRFYNIDFGDTNIRDILAYNPSSFGKKDVTSLDWLKHLGSMSYDELRLTNSPKTFEKYFGKITDKPTLLDFLDYNRTTFTNMDGDTWLKKATKAIVVEKASKEKPDEKVDLYTKLTTPPEKYGAENRQIESRRQQNVATLLGLVNIKEPSVYAITNIATVTYGNIGTYMDTSLEKTNPVKYKEELEKVKALIELTATRQANYVDTLYRITKEENRPKLITNRVIVDTMKKYTTDTSARIATTWSKESGSTADKGVKDFMTPLGLYSPSQNVGAEANGVGVRYFIDRVLDDRGSATYSHEMTHLLDGTVLFNNHGRRDGTAAEFYARGIFENSYTPEKDTYFNLNFVYDESKKNGFYNKTPDRFKTDADLKSYMHGSFDVLYSLDYLEAEATRELTAEDKTKYFKKITPIASIGPRAAVKYTNPAVQATHKSEKISEITLDEAKQLTDINSLIDNNILVNRYIINGFNAKGDVKANGYYFVDMFDTIFGVSQNDSGMSGDITFRKQAFELMGALGYYEGFVPYVSNQYKQAAEADNKPLSDTYIFNKVLNGKNYAEFKKAQIKERVAKIDQLKPLTIQYEGQEISLTSQKLSELMQKAVQEELKQIKAGKTTARTYTFIETPVQKLKKAIYKAYLKDSDDFRQSIYNS